MSGPGPRRAGAHRRAPALALAVGLCALSLGACGDTLQVQPIPHNELEGLISANYPVFWLGRSFKGMQITEANRDPSGADSVQYGNCLEGGEGSCTPPIRVVTSPDNSFIPGETGPHGTAYVRGVRALTAQRGRTIEIPTAGVVVGIFAVNARLARAAANTVVPINQPGWPGAALPAPVPNTGFAQMPLPDQIPVAPRVLG
jgi:hypothetical protein